MDRVGEASTSTPIDIPAIQAGIDQKKPAKQIVRESVRKIGAHYAYPFRSASNFWQTVLQFIPILQWLPKYRAKKDLLPDMIGGVTTGVMHVPQGIAYSVLAGVPPVNGLYSSCFPDFFYMVFGTSRHASIGSFAVVALLAGVANTNVQEILRMREQNGSFSADPYSPVEIAMTLTLCVGIIQLLCGLLHLQFLTNYFSDALVSGFTTGAAAHVLIEQFDDLLGVKIPKYSGPGYIFKKLFALMVRIPEAKPIILIVSALSLAFLYIGKEYLTPFLKKRFGLKLPIPWELILMAIGSASSYLMSMSQRYGVPVVQHIPIGVPEPSLPILDLIPACLVAALPIAVVATAVHISMAKMLAKQYNYKIDDQQELYALGFTSILGGLFPVYPVSTALGRTMVNVSSGSRTQLSTVFSCVLLLTLILWLGVLIEPLPMCILAAIITVALKGMFQKWDELNAFWTVSKIDAFVWVFSFVCTLCVDVVWGLAASIAFSLAILVARLQWPRWQHFFQPSLGKPATFDGPLSICVHKFNAPLVFANVERFQKSIAKITAKWTPEIRPPVMVIEAKDVEKPDLDLSTVRRILVLDFSAVNYIDYMGAKTLKEVIAEARRCNIVIYISGANGSILDCMEKAKITPDEIPAIHIFHQINQAFTYAKSTSKPH